MKDWSKAGCDNWHKSFSQEEIEVKSVRGHDFKLIWDERGKRWECSKCGAVLGKDSQICS